MHRKSQQTYRKAEQVYRKAQQMYRKSQQMYRKAEQVYRKAQQIHRKSQQMYRKAQQMYHKAQQMYPKAQQMYPKAQLHQASATKLMDVHTVNRTGNKIITFFHFSLSPAVYVYISHTNLISTQSYFLQVLTNPFLKPSSIGCSELDFITRSTVKSVGYAAFPRHIHLANTALI
jgi:tetratricopeptide (TPR) repeat protein